MCALQVACGGTDAIFADSATILQSTATHSAQHGKLIPRCPCLRSSWHGSGACLTCPCASVKVSKGSGSGCGCLGVAPGAGHCGPWDPARPPHLGESEAAAAVCHNLVGPDQPASDKGFSPVVGFWGVSAWVEAGSKLQGFRLARCAFFLQVRGFVMVFHVTRVPFLREPGKKKGGRLLLL